MKNFLAFNRLPKLGAFSVAADATNPATAAADLPPTACGRSAHRPGLAQWVAGGLVLGVLAITTIPALSQTAGKSNRARALAEAKQIGLALKLFAGDNDGVYPQDGTPAELKKPTTSNAAFAPLFPTYVENETIFGHEPSAYRTKVPDNVIDKPYTGKPVKTLEAGENNFSYMMGLTDAANPNVPLVMDGTDGTGHYTADADKRGGVGAGEYAIVIRLDNSGLLEHLDGPPKALYVPLGEVLAVGTGGKPDGNLLDAALYGQGVKLLDPAVAP